MTCEADWHVPPPDLELSGNEIQLWCASVEVTDVHLKYLQQILSTDELQRARRFHFERDNVRFTVARGLLRIILSSYFDKAPDEISFCYSRYGKPSLADAFGEDTPRFNLSHSGGLVLYAITRGREVGVDIERIRPFPNAEKIVERFFSEREKAEFGTLPKHFKNKAFFTCWTRKEAYSKARGEGMSLPLDQFSVSFLPGEPARLVHTQGGMKEESRWSIKDVITNPGYVAAVAVEGQSLNFRYRTWSW